MLHCISLREVLKINHCGSSLLSIHFVSATDFLAKNQALILCNFLLRPSIIITTFYNVIFGIALSLFWNLNCRMTISCQNGICKHAWVKLGGFPMIIVANVYNLSTGYISSQLHLVVDDLFETAIFTKEKDIC